MEGLPDNPVEPNPSSVSSPTAVDLEALLLPPLHHIPSDINSNSRQQQQQRRRAHTLDVDWGGSTEWNARSRSGSTSASNSRDDNDSAVALFRFHVNVSVNQPPQQLLPQDDSYDDDEDDEDDEDDCGSLEEDLSSINSNNNNSSSDDNGSDDELALRQRGRSHSRRTRRSRRRRQLGDDNDDSNNDESRDVLQRCRQSLLKSRCMRGFLVLCVYYVLVLDPSVTTPETTLLIENFGQPSPQTLQLQLFANSKNATTNISPQAAVTRRAAAQDTATATTTTVVAAAPPPSQAHKTTTVPLSQLPHFHHPGPTRHNVPGTTAWNTPTTLHNDATATSSSGTGTHWVKVPPISPPHPNHLVAHNNDNDNNYYHNRPRPLLSYAHTYSHRLSEPLVFGRDEKNLIFSSDDSADRHRQSSYEQKTRSAWANTLIWLSLICLVVDTSYREYQHYRWYRRYVAASSPVSPEELSRRRHSHVRRSPSPEPLRRRTISTTPRRSTTTTTTTTPSTSPTFAILAAPTTTTTSTATTTTTTTLKHDTHTSATMVAVPEPLQQRGRRRFDSY